MSKLPKRKRGFTLLELLVVITIVGILLLLTDMGGIVRLNASYYEARQETNNRNIVSALLQYAKTNTALGTLPAPYTGNGYTKTVFDPSDAALAQVFRSANLAPTEINDDGSSSERVRVYQNVSLTQLVPLDFQSGPVTTITYQYAAVHQTDCSKSAACNDATPGATAALTTGNYRTWTTTGTDLPPVIFSTLPLQKQMLALTSQKLSAIRDQFVGRVNVQRANAAATDDTNWYPFPYAAAAPTTPNPNLSGSNASTNQGCWDGWYNLNAANVNVLPQIGLTQAQYGTTAWGAQIQYCRDYDPALRGANSLPHYAALRINKSVSLGSAPTSTASDNIFISF